MAKKIIVLILALMIMIIPTYAEYLPYAKNPTNLFLGYYDIRDRITIGGSTEETYHIVNYAFDQNNKVSMEIPKSVNNYAIFGIWNSNFNYDTIYKFSIEIEFDEGVIPEPETGFVDIHTLGARFSIIAEEALGEIDNTLWGQEQIIYGEPVQDYELETSKIFYDKSSHLLSVIFIVPKEESDTYRQFSNYFVVGLGNSSGSQYANMTSFEIGQYTGIQIQGDYTAILNEIASKLDGLAGGGGLTEEQVNQAIQDALTAHDQQLEQEVDSKLDQIMEQINGIVLPYSEAADQINTAFDGLSDVFASSSTASVFKFPAGRMPNGVVLWQEHNIDIGAAWLRVPAKFRSVVQIVCTFTILYAVIKEAIFIIRFIILGRKVSEDD